LNRPAGPATKESVRPLAAIALVLLAGCPPPGDGSTLGDACFVDQECSSGELCGRDGLCWRETDIRELKTSWTINGQPATTTTCARHPDLYIEYRGSTIEDLGFSPVPCEAGQFNVDKLPRDYTRVEVGVDRGPWSATTIGANGTITLDLRF
jgi:hypothetical protein